ncbi:MAG TPA: HNH endonuclease [Gammaproteobacteria bacterium]|nr:HNH endonuclease [Gammaproteobacteria bacterium]
MAESDLTLSRLCESLLYDMDTGLFVWLRKPNRRIPIGKTAGTVAHYGYIQIRIDGGYFRAYRLAWFYVTGRWPEHEIDHKNGITDDNRWCNLREATHLENMQNYKTPAHNTSGYIGVSFCNRSEKWIAHIKINRVNKYLGCFSSAKLAYKAYLEAKKEFHVFNPVPRQESLMQRKTLCV